MGVTIVLSAPMNDGPDVSIQIRPSSVSEKKMQAICDGVHNGISLVKGPLPKGGLEVDVTLHGKVERAAVSRTVARLLRGAFAEGCS